VKTRSGAAAAAALIGLGEDNANELVVWEDGTLLKNIVTWILHKRMIEQNLGYM
jgi:hypothetical protein